MVLLMFFFVSLSGIVSEEGAAISIVLPNKVFFSVLDETFFECPGYFNLIDP